MIFLRAVGEEGIPGRKLGRPGGGVFWPRRVGAEFFLSGLGGEPVGRYEEAGVNGVGGERRSVEAGVAAIVGDQVGFYLGTRAGASIWNRPDSRFYKRKHLEAAHEFYERYGGFSVVAARYVPIVRTFVPFVAGVARMPYRNFVFWNIGGGILWVTSLLWVGYYLGQTSLANRLDKIIVVVVLVSVLPMVVGILKKWMKRSPAV